MRTASMPVKYGKRLRWARNVVKKFEVDMAGKTRGQMTPEENKIWDEGVIYKRYQRACGLILADKLTK